LPQLHKFFQLATAPSPVRRHSRIYRKGAATRSVVGGNY
jgi:hypothetical protein